MYSKLVPLLLILLFSIQASALNYPLEVFETLPLGETTTARTNVGITHGFPFPEGAISSVNNLRVTGTSAYQFTPLAWHPDGSVKWALVSFMLANLSAGQSDTTTYAIADGGNGTSGGTICTTSSGTVTANTGTGGITAIIKQNNYNILDSVTLNSNGTSLVDPANAGGVFFQDVAGTTFTSSTGNATRFDVVYNGPVYCQVVVEGLLSNTGMGYRMIYDFYKDSPAIKFTFTYKNALFNSNTHKLTNGAWARIGTNMKGITLTGDAAGADGQPKSFTIGPTDAGVVTSYYSSNLNIEEGVSALPTNPAGYAVETYTSDTFTNPTSTSVSRTAANAVPYYQWLKAGAGNKSISLVGRYQGFYYPNGYSVDAATGYLDYHFYTPYFPTKPVYVFPWRLYQSREFQVNFNATGNGVTETKLYQNKPIFIAVDRTHFGKSDVFFSSPFTSVAPTTIQQFMDGPNIPLTNVCQNPSQQGEIMEIDRGLTPSAVGGGKPNNVYAQVTYSTFTSGVRFDYLEKEMWARYFADFEYYLDDKTFPTYPKTNQMTIDFEKNPSNTAQVNSFFPGWQIDIMNEEHNWSYLTDLDFYYYSGSEVFKKGMNGVVDRTWLQNFNYYDYVRPMGMEFQALSQVLRFLKETKDSRFTNHKGFVTTWLTDILNRVSIPKVGTYSNPTCDSTPDTPALDGICLIGYMQGSGWIAPPGQKFSPAGLQPEIQAIDWDVYNAYGINSAPAPPSGADCPDGARYWMMGQRVGLGLMMLYTTYKELDPANPITETVRLRTLDVVRYLSGDAAGDGAYHSDFSNPKNSVGWYQYCLVNKWWSKLGGYAAGDTGNGYLLSYLYTWAAEQSTSPSEIAWWHNHAVNELLAINANAVNGYTFTCDRELDPRTHYTIKSFLDSGLTYSPSNYPAGTPYPGNSGPANNPILSHPYAPSWGLIQPTSVVPLGYDTSKTQQQNGTLLAAAIQSLTPGQMLLVGSGTYDLTSPLKITLKGTASQPIWIVGTGSTKPIIKRASSTTTPVIEIGDSGTGSLSSDYFVLHNLDVTGGETGIKVSGTVAHLWLNQNHVYSTNGGGIRGRTANTDTIYVTKNEVNNTAGSGEGIQFGSGTAAVFKNSVVALNSIYNTTGTSATGFDLGIESFNNLIAENTIHDTAWPCVFVNKAKTGSVNTLEKNIIYACGDNGIQLEGGGIIVRNNLLVGPFGNKGLDSSHNETTIQDITIVHNTIIDEGSAGVYLNWNGTQPNLTFRNNVVYVQSTFIDGYSINTNYNGGTAFSGNVVFGEVVKGLTQGYTVGNGLSDFTSVTAWQPYGGAANYVPSPAGAIIGSADPLYVLPTDLLGNPTTPPYESGALNSTSSGGPVLSSISPSAINTGSSSQLFTLTGTGFVSGAQVKVGTLALMNATFVSSQQLTFTLSSSVIASLGIGDFSVYVQNPNGMKTGSQTLSILATGSPVLDSFTPVDLEWNTSNTFTLNGSGFLEDAQVVLISSLNQNIFKAFPSTFVNSGKLTFTITAADTQVMGPSIYKVVVKNWDGKLSNSLPNFVVYWPYITGQSYTSIPFDAPITLNVTGYYFKTGASAHVGTDTYSLASITPTSVSISFTSAQLQGLGVGTHSLFIQNPAGGTSNSITFTITESGDPVEPPAPPSGPPSSGGPSSGSGGGGGGGGGSGSGGSGGPTTGTGTVDDPLTCVPAFELCNGVDDSCDGIIDEGCDAPTNTCSNNQKDDGEFGIDCGGICSNACLLPIPESLSILFFAALNPIFLLVQAILRLFGL